MRQESKKTRKHRRLLAKRQRAKKTRRKEVDKETKSQGGGVDKSEGG